MISYRQQSNTFSPYYRLYSMRNVWNAFVQKGASLLCYLGQVHTLLLRFGAPGHSYRAVQQGCSNLACQIENISKVEKRPRHTYVRYTPIRLLISHVLIRLMTRPVAIGGGGGGCKKIFKVNDPIIHLIKFDRNCVQKMQ